MFYIFVQTFYDKKTPVPYTNYFLISTVIYYFYSSICDHMETVLVRFKILNVHR